MAHTPASAEADLRATPEDQVTIAHAPVMVAAAAGEPALPPRLPLAVSSRVSLESLARVELQSIMHWLTRAEFTRLARCCHRLFSDADTKLAWRYVNGLALTLDQPSAEVRLRLRRSLCCRHGRIKVTLIGHQEDLRTQASIEAMLDMPRIHALAIGIRLYQSAWQRITRHPAMQHLEALYLSSTLNDDVARAEAGWTPLDVTRTLSHLKELADLSLPLHGRFRCVLQEGYRLPALQTLGVVCPAADECASFAVALRACSRLNQLIIVRTDDQRARTITGALRDCQQLSIIVLGLPCNIRGAVSLIRMPGPTSRAHGVALLLPTLGLTFAPRFAEMPFVRRLSGSMQEGECWVYTRTQDEEQKPRLTIRLTRSTQPFLLDFLRHLKEFVRDHPTIGVRFQLPTDGDPTLTPVSAQAHAKQEGFDHRVTFSVEPVPRDDQWMIV